MIDTLLSLLAPHHCYGCGKVGSLLCENCKYNITSDSFNICISCGYLASPATGLCGRCKVAYERAWCVGERADELQQLIKSFKFQRAKAAYRPLADLLSETLPELPKNTVIVPIPTLSSHIRQRGYDHTLLVARRLASSMNLHVEPVLRRQTATKQVGADRALRLEQARAAFSCNQTLKSDVPYLLVDDVITTGATLEYAARSLKKTGATVVWVAAVARQPLNGPRAL